MTRMGRDSQGRLMDDRYSNPWRQRYPRFRIRYSACKIEHSEHAPARDIATRAVREAHVVQEMSIEICTTPCYFVRNLEIVRR